MTNPNEVTEQEVVALYRKHSLFLHPMQRGQMAQVLSDFIQSRSATSDAARLDWYETHGGQIVNLGETWYWRTAYGQSHRKVRSLRAAIDAAIAAGGSQNG